MANGEKSDEKVPAKSDEKVPAKSETPTNGASALGGAGFGVTLLARVENASEKDLEEQYKAIEEALRAQRASWTDVLNNIRGITPDEKKMWSYILENGFADNRPDAGTAAKKENAIMDTISAARKGREYLDGILNNTIPAPRNPRDHQVVIHDVMWALYAQSVAKGYPFIGGMIVLEDGGRLAEFLKIGGKSDAKKSPIPVLTSSAVSGLANSVMNETGPNTYYERDSSHFQERRTESLGMDFHDPELRMTLNKGTLHFGTLADNNATFVKFEYYGFHTPGDKMNHAVEYGRVKFLKLVEVGFREDPSEQQVDAIKKFIKEQNIEVPKEIEHPSNGRPLSLVKSGFYWARVLLEAKKASEDTKRRLDAIAGYPRILGEAASHGRIDFDNPSLRQGEEVIFSHQELTQWFGAKWEVPILPEFPKPGFPYDKDEGIKALVEELVKYNAIVTKLNQSEELERADYTVIKRIQVSLSLWEKKLRPKNQGYFADFKKALYSLNQAVYFHGFKQAPKTTTPTAATTARATKP